MNEKSACVFGPLLAEIPPTPQPLEAGRGDPLDRIVFVDKKDPERSPHVGGIAQETGDVKRRMANIERQGATWGV
jgi:hypothetical protein